MITRRWMAGLLTLSLLLLAQEGVAQSIDEGRGWDKGRPSHKSDVMPVPLVPDERFPSLEENPFFPLQRSIVLIFTETPTGPKRGTGWVIQREGDITLIVTPRYVVSDHNTERPSDAIQIELYSENEPEYRLRFPAQIRDITAPGDALDLAVLEVRNLPEDIEALPLASSGPPLNSDILIIGHPVTGNPWSLQRGYISAITAAPDQQNLQVAGMNLAVGVGGAPILYNQEVVGLLVTISNQQTVTGSGSQGDLIGGFGFAYPLEVIEQQLQDWGITP